jgi:hypothetical protein
MQCPFIAIAALVVSGAGCSRGTQPPQVQQEGPGLWLSATALTRVKLVFVIDTTNDAAVLREQLAAAMPGTIESLFQGDADLDGARDQARISWLRAGVASADQPWPGIPQPGCNAGPLFEPMLGDDGSEPPCTASPWIDAATDDASSESAAGSVLACITRRATRTTCPIHQGGRAAVSDPLEPDARTIAIILTLSDDCTEDARSDGDPRTILDEPVVDRLACVRRPFDWITLVAYDFWDRRNEFDYFTIGGFPPDLHSDGILEGFLGSWRSDFAPSTADPAAPQPICTGPGGAPVDPGFHWVNHRSQTPWLGLRDASVCGDDLSVPVRAIVRQVGAALARSCVPDHIPSDLTQCDLIYTNRDGCAEPGLEDVEYRGSPACAVRPDAWSVDTSSELAMNLCGHFSTPRLFVPSFDAEYPDAFNLVCPRAPCGTDDDCNRLNGGEPGYQCDPDLRQCR